MPSTPPWPQRSPLACSSHQRTTPWAVKWPACFTTAAASRCGQWSVRDGPPGRDRGPLPHVEVPVAGLLSKEYAALRRGLIDPNQAQAAYPPGDPRKMLVVAPDYRLQPTTSSLESVAGDADGTTYLATVDAQGNMVSATPSSFAGLTQGMILGDTGILINCRGYYFWLDPDNPNVLAPRKRPHTTPCTFIVLKQGQPCMTLGTPGGDSQPQSCLQVFTNMVDFGLNVQEAVEAPRFCGSSFPQSPWPHRTYPNRLEVEGRFSQALVEALNARGHRVEVVRSFQKGSAGLDIAIVPASSKHDCDLRVFAQQ